MKNRYWIFGVILIVAFVAAGIAAYVEITHSSLGFNATHWLSLAAILAAVTGWTATSFLTLYSARRQHTINVLLQSRLSPAYQQRLRDVTAAYPMLPSASKVVGGDWKDKTKIDGIEGIKYLLNYFEFVAIGIKVGDLDERTMRLSLRGIILALTDVAEQYIKYARGELAENDGFPSVTAYENILWLRSRWK